MTSSDILELLVRAKLEQAAPALRQWCNSGSLQESLRGFLRPEVERLDSEKLAKQFAYHCPVAGASHRDYLNRRHQDLLASSPDIAGGSVG